MRSKKEFAESAIRDALRSLLDMGVEIFTPMEELLEKAVRLAFHAGLSFCGSLYVALADHLGARMLMADQAIYKKAHGLLPITLIQG